MTKMWKAADASMNFELVFRTALDMLQTLAYMRRMSQCLLVPAVLCDPDYLFVNDRLISY